MPTNIRQTQATLGILGLLCYLPPPFFVSHSPCDQSARQSHTSMVGFKPRPAGALFGNRICQSTHTIAKHQIVKSTTSTRVSSWCSRAIYGVYSIIVDCWLPGVKPMNTWVARSISFQHPEPRHALPSPSQLLLLHSNKKQVRGGGAGRGNGEDGCSAGFSGFEDLTTGNGERGHDLSVDPLDLQDWVGETQTTCHVTCETTDTSSGRYFIFWYTLPLAPEPQTNGIGVRRPGNYDIDSSSTAASAVQSGV